jgi:ribose 5-phosphate isomerase A
MPDLDAEKQDAAARAVEEIQPGMLVGLGTGSTAAHAVRALGKRVADGLLVQATATSVATESLARSLSISLVPFAQVSRVDLTIDGADEITETLCAIKGAGGALLREKVVAAASARTIIITDSSKLVTVLGTRHPLPLEVLPFAIKFVEQKLSAAGYAVVHRRLPDGSPALTDQGNWLFDVTTGPIENPSELAAMLAALPGVLEHGLFLTEITDLVVATAGQVRMFSRSRTG